MGRRLYRKQVALIGKAPYREWDVTPPGQVNGTDEDTEYSDFVTIPDPKPSGSGLFGVPGFGLQGQGDNLNLQASVEFHDDDGLVSSAALGDLAFGDVSCDGFGFTCPIGWNPNNVGPGAVAYTSPWVNVGGEAIPYDARSYWLVTFGALVQTNTVYNHDLSFLLEFGTEGGGVLFSVDPIHRTDYVSPTHHPGDGHVVTQLTSGAIQKTWAGELRKARFQMSGSVEAAGVNIYTNISGALNRIHVAR